MKDIWNFYPLEVVDRYSDPQLQVGKNYVYLFAFMSNYQSFFADFKTQITF